MGRCYRAAGSRLLPEICDLLWSPEPSAVTVGALRAIPCFSSTSRPPSGFTRALRGELARGRDCRDTFGLPSAWWAWLLRARVHLVPRAMGPGARPGGTMGRCPIPRRFLFPELGRFAAHLCRETAFPSEVLRWCRGSRGNACRRGMLQASDSCRRSAISSGVQSLPLGSVQEGHHGFFKAP